MLEKQLTVINRFGLHARAATCLINLCCELEEKVTLRLNGIEADGRSILDLLMLEAVKDTTPTVRVEGDDEEMEAVAMQKIEALFNRGFYENAD